MHPDDRKRRLALEAYAQGDLPVADIARAYSVSVPRLRSWVREAGLQRRSGRGKLRVPK